MTDFEELIHRLHYAALHRHTITVVLFGVRVAALDLETLIRVKRAAGRPTKRCDSSCVIMYTQMYMRCSREQTSLHC